MTFTFGWAGWVFGSPENAPTNIAGLAVVLSFALMGCAFFRQGDQFSESWKILVPIITAVLGYVFGKKV